MEEEDGQELSNEEKAAAIKAALEKRNKLQAGAKEDRTNLATQVINEKEKRGAKK